MKKVFFIILIFASVKSFSQNAYTPMNFDTSCYWLNHLNIYFGGTTCSGTLVSYIEKDTFINSQQYFIMTTYASDSDVGGNCVKGYNGSIFVREDTNQRKVMKYIGGNVEEVLVDFSLNIGDTLKVGIGHFQIDSVTIDTINNIPRRRQWYHNIIMGVAHSTIEGIGITVNFPFTGYGEWDTPYFQLQCFGRNGNTYYGTQNCNKSAPLSAIDFIRNNAALYFSENILTVKNITELSELLVFNLLGNKVYSEKINAVSYSKDLSTVLPRGFYIVAVLDEKNKSVLKIVIK